MECPKCHYVRKARDTSPDYECPKCGIIYVKFDSAVAEREAALRAKLAMRQAVKQALAGLVVLIMIGTIAQGDGGGSGGMSTSSKRDKFVNDPAMRLGAQAAIQSSGYRCESVINMTTLLIGRGVKVVCDNYRDIHSVTDEGGRLIVRLE